MCVISKYKAENICYILFICYLIFNGLDNLLMQIIFYRSLVRQHSTIRNSGKRRVTDLTISVMIPSFCRFFSAEEMTENHLRRGRMEPFSDTESPGLNYNLTFDYEKNIVTAKVGGNVLACVMYPLTHFIAIHEITCQSPEIK